METLTGFKSISPPLRHHNDSAFFNDSFKCNQCYMVFSKPNMLKMHQIIHEVDDKFSFKYGPTPDVEGLEDYFLSRRGTSSKTKRSETETTPNKQSSLSDIMNIMKTDYARANLLSPDNRGLSTAVAMTTEQTRTATNCNDQDNVHTSNKRGSPNTNQQFDSIVAKDNDEHHRKRCLPNNSPENTVSDVNRDPQTDRIGIVRNHSNIQSVQNTYIQPTREICHQHVTPLGDRNIYKRSLNDDIRKHEPNEKRIKLDAQSSEFTNPDGSSFRYYSNSGIECNSNNRICTQTYIEDDIERERDFLVEERYETNTQNSLSPGINSEDRTHEGVYKCTYCGVMMKQNELRKHIFIAHESVFETNSTSELSSSILHGSKYPSSANINLRENGRQDSKNSTSSDMEVNSQIHRSYNPCHKCGFCGRVFNNVTKLRTHIGHHVRNEIHGQKQQKVLSSEELSLILKYL